MSSDLVRVVRGVSATSTDMSVRHPLRRRGTADNGQRTEPSGSSGPLDVATSTAAFEDGAVGELLDPQQPGLQDQITVLAYVLERDRDPSENKIITAPDPRMEPFLPAQSACYVRPCGS
jgi:hypothetical protein